jgi:hypothetical protein
VRPVAVAAKRVQVEIPNALFGCAPDLLLIPVHGGVDLASRHVLTEATIVVLMVVVEVFASYKFRVAPPNEDDKVPASLRTIYVQQCAINLYLLLA